MAYWQHAGRFFKIKNVEKIKHNVRKRKKALQKILKNVKKFITCKVNCGFYTTQRVTITTK